jgi:broad specificity phosphatase PhoE
MMLLLIRHAKMTGDPEICPASPVSGCLSEAEGIPQARALAEKLHSINIDAAFSSPMGRALQTAELALTGRNVPIKVLPFLREWIPSPELSGSNSSEFETMLERDRYRYAEETWKTELGEGCFDMYARICPPFLKELAMLGVHQRMGGFVLDERAKNLTLAVFSHGGTLNVLLSFILGLPPFPFASFAFELTGIAALRFTERRGIFYPMLTIPS